MAISVADNFSYKGTKPMDERLQYNTVADMKSVVENTLYDGCMAYVKATKKYYTFDSSNETDVTLGRWRESETGTTITIDSTPTENSTNAVQSGGTYTALNGKVDKVNGKGLSTEDYTTAEKTKLSGVAEGAQVNTISSITLNGDAVTPDANKNVALTVITNTVNNLLNYYLKTETYSKTEVDTLLSAVSGATFESVSELPTTNIKTNVIYLVPKQTPETSNIKDEYINLDGTTAGWELIGDTGIDLSDYVTTTALNTALSDYTTTADLTTLLSGKVDKVNGKQLSTEDYTSVEKTKLAGLSNYDDTALSGRVSDIEDVVPSTATTSNKLATMADVGGTSGHTIEDSTGVDMTARTNLQFVGATVTDDSTNDRTVVTVAGGGQTIQYDTMPTASSENEDDTIQYIGATTSVAPIYTNGYFYKCVAQGTDPETYAWEQTNVQPNTDISEKEDVFRYTTMPTASQDNEGDIVQYIGTTTSTYTNGYFYKCIYEDDVYKWVESKTQETIVEQMVGATVYADGKSGSAPKPYIADRNRALFGDGKYHDIYTSASGSTVLVTAESSAFDGSTVTITDGVNSLTATMTDEVATFTDVQFYGTVNASVTNSQDITALGSTSMQAFGMYIIPVSADYSIINLTAEDVELRGQTVDVYLNKIQKGGTTFNVLGQASIVVAETGIYEIKSKVGNRFAKTTVNVAEIHQTYTSTLKLTTLFAVHYSEIDSNPNSCTYPQGYSNSDFTDPFYVDLTTGQPHWGDWDNDLAKFLIPKPCMLKYDGTVDYYLDPNDYTKKMDGTDSDVTNLSYGGNAMMEWAQDGRRIYWTLVPDADGQGWTWIVGDGDYDGLLHPWNHYDCNNNVNRHFYMSCFNNSYVSSGKARSISGYQPSASTTRQNEVTYARANNTTSDVIWDTWVYADWFFLSMMCVLFSKSLATQLKFGRGFVDYSWNNRNDAKVSGGMNDKGLFYGDTNGGTSGLGVKVFGIEHPWGNGWKGIRGLINDRGTMKVKLTHGNIDGTTVTDYNFDGSGYESVGTIGGTTGGYIKNMNITSKGLTPKTISGSDTTYYGDGVWFDNSQVDYALVGGYWYYASLCGAFCCNVCSAASLANACIGSALSCKPLATD